MPRYPYPNHLWCAVGYEEATGGTETSQYPEEKKSTEIPSVVVSESGRAQTRRVLKPAGVARRGLHGVWESTAFDSQVYKSGP